MPIMSLVNIIVTLSHGYPGPFGWSKVPHQDGIIFIGKKFLVPHTSEHHFVAAFANCWLTTETVSSDRHHVDILMGIEDVSPW